MDVTKTVNCFLGFTVVRVLGTYQDLKEFILSITQIILRREFNIRNYMLAFKEEIKLHVRFDGLVANQVCVRFERKPFAVLYAEVHYVVYVIERFTV